MSANWLLPSLPASFSRVLGHNCITHLCAQYPCPGTLDLAELLPRHFKDTGTNCEQFKLGQKTPSLCKPTHSKHFWELDVSGAIQILDLSWLIRTKISRNE